MVNSKRCIVSEGLGTKKVGNYKDQVLNFYDKFDQFGRKQFTLDSEISLSYRDQKQYAVVCISTYYDIKEAEAQKFLERAEEIMTSMLSGNDIESRGSIVQDNYLGSLNEQNNLQQSQTQAKLPEIDMINF